MTDVLETVPVLLANVNLSEYDNMLATESLVGLENVMIESRPALLQHLKQRGITSLAHRQKIANALAKARRAGRLPANPVADAALVLRNDLAMTSGSGHPITITGKTDGFGAQLHAQMSGIAFAIANGRTYQHTPMGPKMDHLAPGEAPADYDEFGGMGLRSPPATPMAEVHEYVAEVHNGDTHACDHYYSEPVCALLRRKYDDAPKPPLPVGLVLDGFIACHIRRGDVGADANTTRYTPNAVYGELLPLLAMAHPGLPLVIFSQGAPADFDGLQQACSAANVRLVLGGDVRTTFHALTSARALLIARSSFSYAAALLSRGTVYADIARDFWHRPLSRWRFLVPEVTSALAAWNQQQKTEWRAAWAT